MDVKLVAAVVAVAHGESLNVSAFCRQTGTTRKTFYKWVNRVREHGVDGLEDRSTRPKRSPNQIGVRVENEIVRLRKDLDDQGLDHGATTIWCHLNRNPAFEDQVPSIAGIHRVLTRRGMVTAQPSKRPKSSWNRFEAASPNERWQIDATEWPTATGTVQVFNIIDDHSRLAVGSVAVTEASSEAAWAVFTQAATTWGLPAGVLSDNGLCFSGKLRGFEVLFESNLRDAGIKPVTGRPYHPQTTGKVERFQQTLKRWLRRQPLAESMIELQAQLDAFLGIYNHERPHQGIGRAVPAERWHASPRAQPAAASLDHPTFPKEHRFDATVRSNGIVCADHLRIHIGVKWAGHDAIVIINTDTATVIINNDVARYLTLDRTRDYQPSHKPRGGPRQQRLPS